MSNIKIGWASRDISTDKPINLPGQFHMRPSKGVLDPVTTTALVVDDGNDSAQCHQIGVIDQPGLDPSDPLSHMHPSIHAAG